MRFGDLFVEIPHNFTLQKKSEYHIDITHIGTSKRKSKTRRDMSSIWQLIKTWISFLEIVQSSFFVSLLIYGLTEAVMADIKGLPSISQFFYIIGCICFLLCIYLLKEFVLERSYQCIRTCPYLWRLLTLEVDRMRLLEKVAMKCIRRIE